MQFLSGNELAGSLKEELLEICTTPHRVWKPLTDDLLLDSKNGTTISTTLDFINGVQICKIEGIIDVNASVLFDILLDFERQPEWDEYCNEARVVEDYDSQHSVGYASWITSVPSAPRDAVTFRVSSAATDSRQFMIGYRSVNHPNEPKKDGFVRLEMFPSGWLLTSLPEDHVRTHVVRISQCDFMIDETDPLAGTNFTDHTIAISSFGMLKKYILRSTMDHHKKYLSHLAGRTYKEICDLFMTKDDKADDWKRVLKMEGHVDIWSKKLPEHQIMCTTGLFKINVASEEVYRVLINLQINGGDASKIVSSIVEEIDTSMSIWYICWHSALDNRLFDAVILMYERLSSAGIHEIVSRSVIHPRVPVFPDKIRTEILPTGYFVYPSRNSPDVSIVSYCFQVDLGIYKDASSFSMLEQTFVVRSMGMINALRAKILLAVAKKRGLTLPNEEEKNQEKLFSITDTLQDRIAEDSESFHNMPKDQQLRRSFSKKLDIVSRLCSVFVDQHEQKEELMTKLALSEELPDSPIQKKEVNVKKRKAEFPLISLHQDSISETETTQTYTVPSSGPIYRKRQFVFVVSRGSKDEAVHYSINSSSLLEMLPNEIILRIMYYLDPHGLLRLASTNKRFKLLAEDESLWKEMYSLRFPPSSEKELRVDYDWKHTFKGKCIISDNWETGKYKRSSLEGHTKAIRAISWNDDFIVSGSTDKTVKLWNSTTGECIFTWTGSNSGVNSLVLEGTTILAGYKSGLMRSWDLYSKICLWEKQFSYWSEGFRFADKKIFSWDQTSIQLWEMENGKLLASLTGHSKKVSCVEVYDKAVASGASDKLVKRWDLELAKCTSTFQGHSATINCVDLDINHVASGSNDKTVKLWDQRTPREVLSFSGHVCPVRCVKMNNFMLVSGGADNSLRVWDKRINGKSIQRLEGHESPIMSLVCDEKKIVSGSNEGHMFLWDFSPSRRNTFLQLERSIN